MWYFHFQKRMNSTRKTEKKTDVTFDPVVSRNIKCEGHGRISIYCTSQKNQHDAGLLSVAFAYCHIAWSKSWCSFCILCLAQTEASRFANTNGTAVPNAHMHMRFSALSAIIIRKQCTNGTTNQHVILSLWYGWTETDRRTDIGRRRSR